MVVVCDDGVVSDPGPVLAAAFVARSGRRIVDESLRLLTFGDGRPPLDPDPGRSLGELHEALIADDDRTARGAWYTPSWLAERLVGLAVDRAGTVLDPACGAGAFLLAAADRLVGLGATPEEIVGDLLHGIDIDPLAVAVAEAELWLWSAERGVPVVPGGRLWVADALDHDLPQCDVVVGNPPFLGQLKQATASDPDRRHDLQERFGGALGPYTDLASLFLLHAVRSVRPGGRVAMIQPQSLLAARDAGPVRRAIDLEAGLEQCWIGGDDAFEAGVRVCAPVLVADGGAERPNDWTRPLLEVRGVPATIATGTRRVADLATVVSGFRDEYYGLDGHVVEGGDGPRLVTAGRIDPLVLRDVPIRFAKQRWTHPTVVADALSGRAAAWVEAQRGPKLLVATQTKVLEAVADPDGRLVAGVPVIVVRPHDPADLWPLAAVLHAPCVSTWMHRHSAGTGLSAEACRPTADLIGRIPLPTDDDRWAEATDLARELSRGAGCWDEFGRAADAAYGIDDPELRSWWRERLPVR